MLLVSETVQIPKQSPEMAELPFGMVVKMLNPCQCCKRRLMETYGICYDCKFFCHGYCEFGHEV